jgi:hypothetical protein
MVRVGGGTEKGLQNAKMRKEGKEGEEGRGGVKKHTSPSPATATGPERNPGPKESRIVKGKNLHRRTPNKTASGDNSLLLRASSS